MKSASLVYILLCCGVTQPEVSIRVSPDRSQFFNQESMLLSCEEDGRAVEGSVKRSEDGTCGNTWGKPNGWSCFIKVPYYLWDSKDYWCESKTGEHSKPINIRIHDGSVNVLLESPVRPVPEGSDATLRCLYLDPATKKASSDLPSVFYQNGTLFRSESTGQMTILHVNKSAEGFYKCSIAGHGESPVNWVKVTNSSSAASSSSSSDDDQITEPAEHLITLNHLILKLMVFTLYLISTFLYFSIWKERARARAAAAANGRRGRRGAIHVIMEVEPMRSVESDRLSSL